MLRALKGKKSSSSSGNHATDGSVASSREPRQRRRSRSPFRRRGRSRSKSRGRESKQQQQQQKQRLATANAASGAPIGIASPEEQPSIVNATTSATSSTDCSSVVSSTSRSPYEQVDDDVFLRMQTEQYTKMMDKPTNNKSDFVLSSKTNTAATDAASNSKDSNPLMGYLHGTAPPQSKSSSSSIKSRRSNFAGLSTSSSCQEIKEEEEHELSEAEEEDDEVAAASMMTDKTKKVTFHENTAPSPDRFLHRPTASSNKMKSPSNKVTFAGVNERGQKHSQHRIFLLLLEPNKKVFELVQVAYDSKTATIGYILNLIKAHASEPALSNQKHVGLIRPRDEKELTNLNMLASSEGRIKHGEVMIPLPQDCRSSKCRRLAKTILKTPNVVKLLARDEPLASRPRRNRSRSRSRRSSVSPGRKSSRTESSMDEARQRAALDEASRAATKALEAKIEELEKRLGSLAGGSQSNANTELSEQIRKDIAEKAKARAKLEERMQREAMLSPAERIERMAKEAEEADDDDDNNNNINNNNNNKASLRSEIVDPESFSFDSDDMDTPESSPTASAFRKDLINKSEGPSALTVAVESMTEVLADGIAAVKPTLRRVRNTARSFKSRLKRSKKKRLVRTASAISVGFLVVSFLYGYLGGSDVESLVEGAKANISSPYAIVGLVMGGFFLLFLAARLCKAASRSRGGAFGRAASKKKGRRLRGAAIVRSVPARGNTSRRKAPIGGYGSDAWRR